VKKIVYYEGWEMGFLSEFWQFLKERKLWWITPIIVTLIILGLIIFVAGPNSPVAPFIYTLF